ncbi:tetratricopeptide repeat protein [Acaryochloris sp. CCMEE 5410]|nr:tetratricopeptide repeat protein [Acaryochloris sp. CCMEE 5410]
MKNFMALINCPECNQKISEHARNCPSCGFLIKSNNSKQLLNSVVMVVTFLGLLIFGLYSYKYIFETIDDHTETTQNQKRTQASQSTPHQEIHIYQKALDKNPNDHEALLKLSRLYSELTEFDKALPLMEKLVNKQPDNTHLLADLAGLYALNGYRAKEEAVYDRILKLDPKSILALASKASLRKEEGDIEAAKNLFARAEKLAPTDEIKQKIKEMNVIQKKN